MAVSKSRKQKEVIYEKKYGDIPRDYQQRLDWMYEHFHLSPAKADIIYQTRNQMIGALQFSKELKIILYEEPEGAPRPRARYINRNNAVAAAKANPGFIQIYSLTGDADRTYMKRLLSEQELLEADYLINTPCVVHYEAYIHTPTQFNAVDTYLAELGVIRPITKPDFDNLEKKYSDMYNGNVWLDDALVIESSMSKYYSILPRVEITLKYLNMLYNRIQYESIVKRVENVDNVTYFRKE
jgi:Holliday junction resolvase RusA-like endonuclease